MLHAEAQDGAWLADPDLDVHRDWRAIRDRLARTYAFADTPLASFGPDDVERLRPLARRTAALWDALPAGGSIEVRWPGADDPVVVPTETRGALAFTRELGIDALVSRRDERGERVRVALALGGPRRRARARNR
jgi:hypothetical protein